MERLKEWLVVGLTTLSLAGGTAASLTDHASAYRKQLAEKVFPYWYDTALDVAHGGYILADDLGGKMAPSEKAIVTQSRMVWGFAHAHLNGYSTEKRNYLKAAEHGYRFLLEKMRDPINGGYYWQTDGNGNVKNNRKIIYGQSFVIYALVEYYRASGKQEALDKAMELYRLLQKHAYDIKHGGWVEHFESDWKPILKHEPEVIVERGGCKSANTHLHLMEAFTELYEATRDPEVKKSLAESVMINCRYFYPPKAEESCFHREMNWERVMLPESQGLSYGHNVEFAWLMVRAEKVLGKQPSWDHFYAHIDHALKQGYDWERGGIYYRGVGNEAPTVTDKVWWAEAELIAALSEALVHKPDVRLESALAKQIEFLDKYQTAPDGIWLDTVTSEGKPKSARKAHAWKANYHDVRAMVMLTKAFSKEGKSN
jgi:mannobiose 2-epimerase